MAEPVPNNLVILAVKPEFAEKILQHEKTVEFRKTIFSKEVSKILIYASSPIKKIVGCVDIEKIDKDAPTVLWRRYKHYGGISRRSFEKYFGGCKVGVAIQICSATEFSVPLSLTDFEKPIRAPQSFVYAKTKLLEEIDILISSSKPI